MQRFIFQQNIDRFQRLLADRQLDDQSYCTVQSLLLATQRDLAIFEAEECGAYARLLPGTRKRVFLDRATRDLRRFQADFESSGYPYLILDPGPGLHIVDINDAYAAVTMTARGAIAGQKMFDVFPDNPADPLADGVKNLYASLCIATETAETHTMLVQRYDVRNAEGDFVERYWQPLNTPIFDEKGHLAYILHSVRDVTEETTARVRACH